MKNKLKTLYKITRNFTRNHKKTSICISIFLVIIFIWGFKKITNTSGEIRYITAQVSKATVIVSITGTGQVSATNQVDLKAKSSGDVMFVNVVSGQEVGIGALIAGLDTKDTEKAVRDAELNLQSAELSLEKLKKPADSLDLLKAQNTLTQVTNSLTKSYDDGFTAVANTFLEIPTVISGLDSILHGNTVNSSGSQDNIAAYSDLVRLYSPDTINIYRDDAESKYITAHNAYDKNLSNHKSATHFSSASTIDALINETYNTTKIIAEAVKSTNDFLNFVKNKITENNEDSLPTLLNTHLDLLATYIEKTNTSLSSLLTIKNTITNSNLSIPEKTQELQKVQDGADALDINSSELLISQKRNALLDAQEKLNDSYIRAPFSGTIAKLAVKHGDSITSGTIVSTIITKDKLAEISLNEVDVAKIKIGQKATLTFDAVPDLSIAGTVAEVDSIGTVSQGVVTYIVKVSFIINDNRVKPGMTVSAEIVTDTKQDVLTVPNSAVKSSARGSYIEMFDRELPRPNSGAQGSLSSIPPIKVPVEIGLSNDSITEIISGLKEGDIVISRAIIPSSTTATTSTTPSIFGGSSNRGSSGVPSRVQGK